MYNYYERTYYTLDDIRKALGGAYADAEGPYSMAALIKNFSTFLYACLQKSNFETFSGFKDTEESATCFQNYIWPKFYKEAIIYTDLDESEDFVKKFDETKLGQIFAWWMSSTEKYTLLIKNLTANKNKLLDDVKSASISRFNDTPQNSGDFSDDNHTSTVTKTENSSNVGTMMARLNEIEDNIKQLYIDWSNEFRKFIIWSVN